MAMWAATKVNNKKEQKKQENIRRSLAKIPVPEHDILMRRTRHEERAVEEAAETNTVAAKDEIRRVEMWDSIHDGRKGGWLEGMQRASGSLVAGSLESCPAAASCTFNRENPKDLVTMNLMRPQDAAPGRQ
jgi:hypothetical protein